MKNWIVVGSLAAGAWAVSGCASTTESGAVGIQRRQLMLVSAGEVNDLAAKGYSEMKQDAARKGSLDQDSVLVRRVQEVAKRLIPQTRVFRSDAPGWSWESHVVTTDELNAFCMPGGKIMVFSGLMKKLNLTDGELAAVMGHEISHALREHGRERLSEEMVQQVGLEGLMATGKLDPKYAAAASTVSGLLVTLPHGRTQETEADEMGVELMARAGYDPAEALSLWKKMGAAAGGSKPPEFLSTHPSDVRRLRNIESLLPKVRPLYEQASKARS